MDRAAIEVSADPSFLRSWVEQTYVTSGVAGVDQLPDLVAERAADDFAITRSQARQSFAIQRVLPSLLRQIQILKSEVRAFENQFGAAATRLVTEMLDDSDHVARAELARYGIDVRTLSMTLHGPDDKPGMSNQTVSATTVRGGDNGAARDMAGAARELAGNQREIDRMRARVAELHDVQRFRQHAAPGAGAGAGDDPAPPVNPYALASAPDPARLAELLASMERLVTQADRAHQARIAVQTEAHPLLASYKRSDGSPVGVDADALERLNPSNRGQEIHDRIAPVLANIAATRAALGKRLNVWKEPRVVQLTMARMLVAPGSLQSAMIERKVAREQEGAWTDWAIMALSFGLAVLSAIPTGGSSLAGGVVVAASVAGAVTDVYLVVDHVRSYQLDNAKAGTDLDAQARAISTEHPSLFWLAFDLVATGVGLSAAAKTFGTVAKDLAKAERVVATGARLSTEEGDIAIARVHRLAREGKLSAEAAERADGKIRLATQAEYEGETAAHHTAEASHGETSHANEPRPARHDTRARISIDHLAQLEQRLGVPVVLDDALSNGVELHYVAKRTLLGVGTDIEPTVLKVGRTALVDDVLAHRATIERVTRYNGVSGKLRGLWDRIVVETQGLNPFPLGSRGWASFEEMRKIDHLIEMRRARWSPRTLDAHTLDDEIAFLEGRRQYHEEIVRTAEETGAFTGAGHVDGPDIGKVTAEAQRKGYKLPGANEGVNPEWYYYRDKRNALGEFELAVKPSAPAEAKSYRAVTKDGQFEKLEPGDTPRPQTLITGAWTDQQVIDHLWADASFLSFAKLLEREGLATREEINAAIIAKSANRSRLAAIVDDTVRGTVKDVFRPRLIEKLTDPAIDANTSWQRMRQMLDGLDNADRGNLCELWYQSRYAKGARQHVAATVTRTGERAGQVEGRAIDLVEGNRAIEIKDVGGPIDKDQLAAYLDMAVNELEVIGSDGLIAIKRVRYVFTRPEGARANLGFFAVQLEDENKAGILTIEVFDMMGMKHTLSSAKAAREMLSQLGGPL